MAWDSHAMSERTGPIRRPRTAGTSVQSTPGSDLSGASTGSPPHRSTNRTAAGTHCL
eukprot:CAMPEP_0202800358 /NCGR_PEP_ID=MMETSP1388-20130828/100302_1 /ASSEMBLY_ACC=CAM_ASM_000864 /TAXON_ID=37098 /ORGANISM="Isochrysis sp, Strain CCMP1244" /LENGTH=56 /DNA_ID=CAMNT_0049470341 /DNA_START=216 /DNA_END=383 /DNA_ORIENTATION=+